MLNGEFSVIVDFPSETYFLIHVIACVLNVTLTIATVFLNSVTVLAYWISSKQKEKVSNFLIMLLSLVNLGVGTIGPSLFTLLLASDIATKKTTSLFGYPFPHYQLLISRGISAFFTR